MTAAPALNVLLAPRPRPAGRVDPGTDRIYLHPGQFAVADGPCTMTTILGSCVGVCLHDRIARVGGLNHYLLPRAPAGDASPRYGDIAIQRLIRELERLGAVPRRLVATIAGGACVLGASRLRKADLGQDNVAVAVAALHEAGIRVRASEVEGHRGRRVVFDPHAGTVQILTL